MEDNRITDNRIQLNTTQEISTPSIARIEPLQSTRKPWIAVTIFILLIVITVFLGFQNYQLRQQLARPIPTPSQSVLDNSITSPAPNVEDSQLTSKYQNDKFGFEIKYPKEWSLTAKEHDIQADYREYIRKCDSGEIDGCGGSRWPDYQLEFYNKGKNYFNVSIHVIPLAEYLGGKENGGFTYSVQRVNYNTNISESPTYYISESMEQMLQDSLVFITPSKPLSCLWIPDFVGVDVSRPRIDKSIYNMAKAYYYDNKKNTCQTKDLYYGDGPNIPFSSIDECQKSCIER